MNGIIYRDEKQKNFFVNLEFYFFIQKIAFFIGGSRYFGYCNDSSDLDVFVYSNPSQKNVLYSILKNNGFVPIATKRSDGATQKLTFISAEQNIQISIYRDEPFFLRKKRKHELIKKYLSDEPETLNLFKIFKEKGMSGSLAYELLVKVYRV